MKLCLYTLLLLCGAMSLHAMNHAPLLEGRTPLHVAASQGKIFLMAQLLKTGFTEYVYDEWGLVEIIDHKGNVVVDIKDTEGQTALHKAVRKNRIEAAALLLERGACIEARDNQHRTPALVAAEHGRIRMLSFLLDRGASKNAQNNHGKTVRTLNNEVYVKACRMTKNKSKK